MATRPSRPQDGFVHFPKPALLITEPPLNEHGTPVIRKLLIANRGEIACRIIATCRRLNIASVAVYVNEDRLSRHVQDADEAINIGKMEDAEAGNPFLNMELLISTAISVSAQAIHPGYGYLSENALFAQAVRDAGLIFVGPSAKAMSTLGDKRSSKDYLREHCPDVPLIPGFADTSGDVGALEVAAQDIGYPVMIKASAGGGGKGMRVVHDPSKFREELGRAQSEAQRSFGSADCILERYIESAKHIEVQILGDRYNNVLSLWERECSVQRRHQKIIEETPCPWLTSEQRAKMCGVAVKIGKLLGYEGAGTVEFVFDIQTSQFFFLEVNTRLQVEHPITEEVTGLDIVALQFFVAAGGDLTSLATLQSIPQNGHAIECRLCAEDPQNDFYPQRGLIRLWKIADTAENVRFETAVQTGYSVSIHFDSLMAKVVAWAPTRDLAIEKMRFVLSNTVCLGVRTNRQFLQSCLVHASFRDPRYTTSFIPNNITSLLDGACSTSQPSSMVKMPFFPYILIQHLQKNSTRPFRNARYRFRNQRHDPIGDECLIINSQDSMHKNGPLICTSRYCENNQMAEVHLSPLSVALQGLNDKGESKTVAHSAFHIANTYNVISSALREGLCHATEQMSRILVEKCDLETIWPPEGSEGISPWITAKLQVVIDGQKLVAFVSTKSATNTGSAFSQTGLSQQCFVHLPAIGVQAEYECYSLLNYCESLREEMEASVGNQGGIVKAPMPCKVLSIHKKSGDQVTAGDSVMVVESMKMEINIAVSVSGILDIRVTSGDAVDEGIVLCAVN